MRKELWLEYGLNKKGIGQDMFWYNEGRWQELPYFIKSLWTMRKYKNAYFLWRFGKKNHYLRGKV